MRFCIHSLPLEECSTIRIFELNTREYIKIILKPTDTDKGSVTFIQFSTISPERLAKMFGELRRSSTGGYYIPYVITVVRQNGEHLITSRYQYHLSYGHRVMSYRHEEEHFAHLNGTWYLN